MLLTFPFKFCARKDTARFLTIALLDVCETFHLDNANESQMTIFIYQKSFNV